MGKTQYIALVAAVLVAIVFISLPRTPKSEKDDIIHQEALTLDAKVEEAIAIIESGQGAPMQAISILLDVVQEDPNHEKALLALGNFSMMSRQWQKAVDRFHHLNELYPDVEEYALGKYKSILQLGDTTAVLNEAVNYLNTHPEARQVQALVSDLQN